jgi:hypothetical protein
MLAALEPKRQPIASLVVADAPLADAGDLA